MNVLQDWFAIFASFICLQSSLDTTAVLGEIHGDIFTNCGGLYETPQGVLSTPNFPASYPTPLYCEWLIHAPPGKKIVLYFTQNFMKDSIYISSYDYYEDINLYVGRKELGQIFWEHDLAFLVEYKPYVLIQFSVEAIGNRHLRVIDHLLDVYGFNITYEFIDTENDLVKQTCSVKTCSYLGNCIASSDFSEYSCRCFEKFFGENCQYGPYCDPANGINLCSNGGLCKYFFGSLINQCVCPEGFEGAYCERSAGEVLNVTVLPEECSALKCSHTCDVDFTGQPQCYCPDGYAIEEDNETCTPIDRYRFDVAIQFQKTIRSPPVIEKEKIKIQISKTLMENGITTLSNFKIRRFRNTTETTVMEFYFYCLVSEVGLVQAALHAVSQHRVLFGHQLKKKTLKYEKNPELVLSEVMNYDPHPTLRGKMLTLVCAAKGSQNLRFRWFKDNVHVDTSLTSRNAWETIVPHTVHGMYLSVLNIDSVMPIDQGVFTCQVEDFGESVTGSVDVTVNNYPRVQLDPMSLSVNKGEMITFKCLSPDDSWQQFTYEWYKNGIKILANSQTEYAEQMYPTGVRLVVQGVQAHGEYTCKVTNEAGSANVSAYVFVINDNTTVQFCLRSYVGEVMWSNTSGNHFDVQRCPTEQGGEYRQLGTIDFGYARRHCECDVTQRNCKWTEPNFSKCQSLQLINTYDELELVRNGYQQKNLSDIFDDLYKFVLSKNEDAMLYAGDVDMVAGILKELLSHMKSFPQLVKIDEKKIQAQRLVDLMGAILQRSSDATVDEKSDIMVGPSIVQTVHILITGAIKQLQFSEPLDVSSLEIVMKEELLTEVPCATCITGYAVNKQNKELVMPSSMKVKTLSIRSMYLEELLSYRDLINNKNKRIEFEPVSPVYSVAHRVDDITSYRNPTARFHIDHHEYSQKIRYNTTVCLKWEFDVRNIYSGQWTEEGCVTRESRVDQTICECRLPGHFIAGMIPSNISDKPQTNSVKDISVPLILSYSFSLVLVSIACVVYLRTIGNLNVEIHTVHFSFVCSILLATLAALICLVYTNADQVFSEVLGRVLTFSFYVAIVALTLEMFHLFVITYNIKLIFLTKMKFAIICWGIPVCLMVPTVTVSKYLDDNLQNSCHLICWLNKDTIEFLVFILILGLDLSIYILLLTLCAWSLRKWTEEWRYAERKIYMKSIIKNVILLSFLLLAIGSSVSLESSSYIPHVACTITFQLSLCLLLLVFRCVMNKHVRYLCVRSCCGVQRPQTKSKDQGNYKSFRAFIEPTRVNNVVISQEEDNVSKYYDEVNRKKYTKERKRMLSSLLGSGSRGDELTSNNRSGETTAETSVSCTSSGTGSKESTTSPSSLMDLFSHSGTDCGILINEHSKSTLSVGASGSVKDEVDIVLQNHHNSDDTAENRGKCEEDQFEVITNDSVDVVTESIANSYQKPLVHSKSYDKNHLTNTHQEYDKPVKDKNGCKKQLLSSKKKEGLNFKSNELAIECFPEIHKIPDKDLVFNQDEP